MKDQQYNINLQYDGNKVARVTVTNTGGTVFQFVPEDDCPPAPCFQVGDIVRIIGDDFGYSGQRGIVMQVTSLSGYCIRVGFGKNSRTYQAKSLEAA